jgi:hypothetical protein
LQASINQASLTTGPQEALADEDSGEEGEAPERESQGDEPPAGSIRYEDQSTDTEEGVCSAAGA